ncbi:MAG: hypothetical protein HY253_04140 [Burkholderiales bacterium]|nr:hypothetical protein [Burkholderiales bacterium]
MKSSTAQRRLSLCAQIQEERASLILAARDICNTVDTFETSLVSAKRTSQFWIIGLGAVAGIFIIQPKRTISMLRTGFTCWQSWKKFQSRCDWN